MTVGSGLDIGIAFDLRSDFVLSADAPDDALEEYDTHETIVSVSAALERCGHRPRELGGGRRLVEELLRDPPDLVFNMCEGTGSRSREAHVPAICELLSVPYTHSDPLTLAASLDKDIAKRLVASAGITTPRHVTCNGRLGDLGSLRMPLIAKPIAEGSSKGIRSVSLLDDRDALEEAVGRLHHAYRQPVIVEEFCPGPEFTVGVIGTGDGARPLGAMEIVPRGQGTEPFVYSVDVKRDWEERVEYVVPPRSHADEAERVAVAAHRALGCRDVSRVDLRVDATGAVSFLELNPLPGIGPGHRDGVGYGDLVVIAERIGLGHDGLLDTIVEEARARWGI